MPTFGERLQRLVDDVLERIAAADAESAFALGTWLATLLWKNHGPVYRLDQLEIALLSKVPEPPSEQPPDPAAPGIEVHLATDVYRSGGHSPLMANLIRHADRPVQVVLSRMVDIQTAAQVLGVAPECLHSSAQAGGAIDRVHDLTRHMLKGARVVASLHPNDLIGAVALRMAKRMRPELRIGFVNHADHVFSVGVGAADTVLEISSYGWGLRGPRGSESTSSFMGIPIPARQQAVRTPPPDGQPMFLSGGAAYKFRPLPGLSLPPVLSALLVQHPDARLTVLGPKARDWWWWPLRALHRRRVDIRSALPKESYQKLLNSCTVYIDSHPILGGTALPEALMAGCEVAGIKGVAWGYSVADELLSSTADDFLASCDALIRRDPSVLAQQAETREKCRRMHDPAAVRARMDAALSGERVQPPGMSGLESALASRTRPLEAMWERRGRLLHPGKRECPLTRADQRWLAGRHAAHFGLTSWSSLKLLAYAWTRS
jgi:hypothetical protein